MTNVKPNNTLSITPTTEPERNLKVKNSDGTAGKFSLKCNDLNPIDYTIEPFGEKTLLIPIGTTIFKNTGTVDLNVTTG